MVKSKKHICVIFSCLLVVMVAITPLFTISNNKTTAKADSLYSSNPMIVLPSFTFTVEGITYSMPNLFLSRDGTEDYSLYYVRSSDSFVGYYTRVSLPYSGDIVLGRVHYVFTNSDNKLVYRDPGFDTKIELVTSPTHIDWSTVRSTSVHVANVAPTNDSIIMYKFSDENGNFLKIHLSNFPRCSVLIGADTLPLVTIASNITSDDMVDYLLNSGYNQGYSVGYKLGYDKGFNTTWSDLSPWDALVNGVDDLISAPLFGNVSLKDLLLVAFGVILFGLFIKVFFGG